MDNFDFKVTRLPVDTIDKKMTGAISEYDRLVAAKQILLGLAILFFTTQVIFLVLPDKANQLLEINKIVLPSLATLIIAFYFRDTRGH